MTTTKTSSPTRSMRMTSVTNSTGETVRMARKRAISTVTLASGVRVARSDALPRAAVPLASLDAVFGLEVGQRLVGGQREFLAAELGKALE